MRCFFCSWQPFWCLFWGSVWGRGGCQIDSAEGAGWSIGNRKGPLLIHSRCGYCVRRMERGPVLQSFVLLRGGSWLEEECRKSGECHVFFRYMFVGILGDAPVSALDAYSRFVPVHPLNWADHKDQEWLARTASMANLQLAPLPLVLACEDPCPSLFCVCVCVFNMLNVWLCLRVCDTSTRVEVLPHLIFAKHPLLKFQAMSCFGQPRTSASLCLELPKAFERNSTA